MNFQVVTLSAGLYFVGVPIGTARDITLRALDVLASAQVLAAEDTRSLRKLMDIHGVPLAGRKILALHDHSGPEVIARLLEAVQQGQSVAYASEAGMPMIADPGFELARAFADAGLSVTSAPGPSAVVTALVLAGLPTDAFYFGGFLPASATARQKRLEELRETDGTLVFYESPKRLGGMLQDAQQALGPRAAVVCREITKKFEEIRRGNIEELAAYYKKAAVKGEIVVLIDRSRSEKITELPLEYDLREALTAHSLRDAVELVSQAHDVPRRKVYQMALQVTKDL